MHGSWGNMIDAEDAFARMGADVMRWQYCAQPPDREPALRLRARRTRSSASCSRSGTRSAFLVTYANIEGFEPTLADLEAGPPVERPLDRWLVARTHELVREATGGVRGDADRRRDPRVRGVRRRPLELVHPPLAPALLRRRRRPRSGRSGTRSSSRCASIAPVMPFLDRAPVAATSCAAAPASVYLAGWPEVPEPDRGAARRDRRRAPRRRARPAGAVDVGAEAAPAAAPARRRGRRRAPAAHADEIADELRVKEVEFGDGRGLRAAREAEPAACSARSSARRSREVRAALARGRVRRSSTAAASRWTATCSSRTRCSSSASASRAGRSPPRTASRSRSTRRSTTSCGSRRASTT